MILMGQKGQYLLAMGFGCYKWYPSQTPSDVPAGMLTSK